MAGGWRVGGWLDQLELMLTQLSTGLKVEAELGKRRLDLDMYRRPERYWVRGTIERSKRNENIKI